MLARVFVDGLERRYVSAFRTGHDGYADVIVREANGIPKVRDRQVVKRRVRGVVRVVVAIATCKVELPNGLVCESRHAMGIAAMKARVKQLMRGTERMIEHNKELHDAYKTANAAADSRSILSYPNQSTATKEARSESHE